MNPRRSPRPRRRQSGRHRPPPRSRHRIILVRTTAPCARTGVRTAVRLTHGASLRPAPTVTFRSRLQRRIVRALGSRALLTRAALVAMGASRHRRQTTTRVHTRSLTPTNPVMMVTIALAMMAKLSFPCYGMYKATRTLTPTNPVMMTRIVSLLRDVPVSLIVSLPGVTSLTS